MTRLRQIVSITLATTWLAACDGPTNPSGSLEGVTLYEDTGFDGTGRTFGTDERDFLALGGPCLNGTRQTWDNCASSIRVSPGWSATIYEDPNFLGATLVVTGDLPNLHDVRGPCGDDWDDCISSIHVVRAQ
jgi:hypothetical protein